MRRRAILAACLAVPGAAFAQDPVRAAWSLQPLAAPTIPAGPGATPIDRFVATALAARGLAMSPPADRATLLRRVTFDLHGLPPTPAEIDAFLADDQPDAWERVVDRLLASPHYAEREARHWLDVAHYGETHGYEKDKLRPHAWPYRDWVIRAFDADLPYADFVMAQLAGDVLRPDDPEAVVATGFLAAGPWDFVGHTELRDGTRDQRITRHLDRDDFVTTVMTAFASTTAHCAQCHDHEFDPIPQRDYYRLQAVFAGVDRADRPYWPAAELAARRALEDRATALGAVIADFERRRAAVATPERAALERELTAIDARRAAIAWPPVPATRPQTALGYHSAILARADDVAWLEVAFDGPTVIDRIALVPSWEQYAGHPGPGFGFPRRLRIEVACADGSSRTLVDDATDRPHPGDTPLVVAAPTVAITSIRITATRLFERTADFCFALGEVLALAGDRNLAAGATLRSSSSIEAGERWGARFAVDGRDSRGALDAATLDALLAAARLDAERADLAARRDAAILAALPAEAVQRHASDVQELAAVRAELTALAPRQVYAIATDFAPLGNFRPAGGPRPIHVLERGDVDRPGERVGPGALSCLPHLEHWFAALGPDSPEGARRVALARWLTDRDHPLTWRSAVNRIWQQHFGRGLAATPNDFGRMGSAPSHPELLDWLAVWFRDAAGGSRKALHRLILTSDVYRQVSSHRADATAIDPGNRLLWRMPRQRLDAEQLRDAMLHVAGILDPTRGGPSARHFAFEDDHSPRYLYAAFDVDDPAARRRSIYRHIVRSAPDPWFEALDCADPSRSVERRDVTLTPLQALTTWNDRFTFHTAAHFAARLTAASDDAAERIDLAARLAWGRAPDAIERRAMLDHARTHGLPSLCRVLLNTDAFLFVD